MLGDKIRIYRSWGKVVVTWGFGTWFGINIRRYFVGR